MTTNGGLPVYNNLNSLTAGPRGPVLLEDFHLVEKLANFDREKIPERTVHARGVTAKGIFTCTKDIRNLTCADPFSAVGKETPVAVRFSTVVHSRHSPETLRDPRGFSVKWYTRDGNWDLVGNNMPVFFIRDAIAFPDMVHAFRPNPRTENQEWWRILDFLSHHPESCHMLTFLLDDFGIPKSYQEMNGAGVHTFKMINGQGRESYVKFHWISEQGEHFIKEKEDEIRTGGTDFSHATHALINAIDQGKFPAWRLKIQVMEIKDELNQRWGDPLDVTKTWPEDQFPLMEIGRMELNRNVDNQFLNNEQIAFSPGMIIPGIHWSADKLLQGRIFSYADTQRYRLGPNYLQLPINAPKIPHHNNHYDGNMNYMDRKSEVNYFPSTVERVGHAPQYPIAADTVQGQRTRTTIPKENNFQQPGERWRSFDAARKERFVCRVVDALNEARVTKELKNIWVNYWTQCDRNLGARIAQKVKMSNM